jgi:hypothetical protein
MKAKNKLRRENPCFRISCGVIGAIVVAQFAVGAVALALRVEAAREVRVEEKIVTKLVEVGPSAREASPAPAPAREKPDHSSAGSEKPAEPLVALPPAPNVSPSPDPEPRPEPLEAPPIADPVVERLVHEAREARVAEDMGRAIVKLEEARAREPREPSVLYELGLVYETMAAFDAALADKAAEAFQGVFDLGTSGAGALYPLAARKLRDGIARPRDMRGKLGLGRVRIFRDEVYADGERVVLTIPVNAAPGQEPNPDDFFVQVNFYNHNGHDDPVPAGPEAETDYEWASGEFDWMGGEETLRVTYVLPRGSRVNDHLFGRLSYYGQTVELVYKNELIDSQAWPRHLAAEGRGGGPGGEEPLFLDRDVGPGAPLLPPLEDEVPPIGLPPFPED